MQNLPGNTKGKFSTQKTPEQIQIEATDQIVEAKKSLSSIKAKLESLYENKKSLVPGTQEWKSNQNGIEMLENFIEYLENMLDQLGTFTDNLAEVVRGYDPNEQYFQELKVTLNYMLPLMNGLKLLLTKNESLLQITENTAATTKARSRGDNISYYDGYMNYEGQKFQLRFGLRKSPYESPDGNTRQARFVVGIRDAISSQTDDVVTMRIDRATFWKNGVQKSNLEMDFTYPDSQEITDLSYGDKTLKNRICSNLYENTSQKYSYHFGIKDDVSEAQFRSFGTLIEGLYLKK